MFFGDAAVPEDTRPQDFEEIFSQRVVIVGGHAVNLWASYYAERDDPILASFAPFTSKDADIKSSLRYCVDNFHKCASDPKT